MIKIKKFTTLEDFKRVKAKHLPYEFLTRLFSTTRLSRDDIEDDKFSVKDVYNFLEDTRAKLIAESDRLDELVVEAYDLGLMLHKYEKGKEGT